MGRETWPEGLVVGEMRLRKSIGRVDGIFFLGVDSGLSLHE